MKTIQRILKIIMISLCWWIILLFLATVFLGDIIFSKNYAWDLIEEFIDNF